MVIFKDYIRNLLPDYILINDSYKDVNGLGFVARFMQIFGEELDEFYYPKINNFEDNFSPLNVSDPRFLDYYAAGAGDIPRFLTDDQEFARLLTFLISIYQVKGTAKSYKAILTTLGFSNAEVIEPPQIDNSYDAQPPLLYDDPEVFYDDGCKTCTDYDINITTVTPLTGDTFSKVRDLVSLVEPINAKLKNILWNGDIIEAVFIEVFIDSNGDLNYENANDPGLILTLDNGDLIIDGPNASKYFLDNNGDLYYIN